MTGKAPLEGEGTMDLSGSIGQAVEAARRGDVRALEAELARLNTLSSESVGGLGVRLRAMARCVQDHPSFSREATAQTG